MAEAPRKSDHPLLSFVIVGKNDNYMGNYQWRVNSALNLLITGLQKLGRLNDTEIVFCDWNSDEPFYKTLALAPPARDFVRFVVVPPAIAKPAQRDAQFPNCIAHNVAIQRSRGRFIAVMDPDIVFPAAALASLFNVLDGSIVFESALDRCFMIAHRRQLPVVRTSHAPGIREIETFVRRNASLFLRDPLMAGIGVPAGIALMHRSLWQECRGYDERLVHAGWIDVDLQLRVSQKYPWIDLTSLGVESVHIEHYAAPRGTNPPPRKYNGYPVSRRFAANDENWGLRNVDLEIHPPEVVLDEVAVAAIEEAAVRARAMPISAQSLGTELSHQDIQKIYETILRNFPHPREELDLLRLITWYAVRRRPRTYFELGIQRSAAPAIVIAGCPTCETYLADQWAEDDTGGDPPVYRASNIVAAAAPQAHSHFITADPATATQRLFASIAPDLKLDLALLRTDPLFGDALANAALAADRLTPGGAIAVSGHTPAAFSAVWNFLSPRFQNNIQFQIRPPQGEARMGFILAVNPS